MVRNALTGRLALVSLATIAVSLATAYSVHASCPHLDEVDPVSSKNNFGLIGNEGSHLQEEREAGIETKMFGMALYDEEQLFFGHHTILGDYECVSKVYQERK
jgi:hypothetical protein